MSDRVEDLRRVKLAELYEVAFEGFVLDLAARAVSDDAVRQKLLTLVPSGDRHHDLLAAELRRISEDLTPAERREVTHAALLDVVEVERTARDLYLRLADEVHDPALVKLFRELAKEEEGHVRFAQDLVVASDAGAPSLLRGAEPFKRRSRVP